APCGGPRWLGVAEGEEETAAPRAVRPGEPPQTSPADGARSAAVAVACTEADCALVRRQRDSRCRHRTGCRRQPSNRIPQGTVATWYRQARNAAGDRSCGRPELVM